ncbi:MAG: Sua5/YciO/YrdC/YwlC family protein, partial [Candidatus Marinimicrobia bacterium]|nr:Sua5/YciO/YrdC/YwlC family protein [Candidatus Neomarinimicrobiota bacterium]
QQTGVPITTTSVNRSGHPPNNDPVEIMKTFPSDFELLIDGGLLAPSIGSTIYRWHEHKMQLFERRLWFAG